MSRNRTRRRQVVPPTLVSVRDDPAADAPVAGPPAPQAFYAEPTPKTLLQRATDRLFPTKWLQVSDVEGFAPGNMRTDIRNVLDWRDRLRVLVSGTLMCEIRTVTNVHIERAQSVAVCYVAKPTARTTLGWVTVASVLLAFASWWYRR